MTQYSTTISYKDGQYYGLIYDIKAPDTPIYTTPNHTSQAYVVADVNNYIQKHANKNIRQNIRNTVKHLPEIKPIPGPVEIPNSSRRCCGR
jgi:hypothetical protein